MLYAGAIRTVHPTEAAEVRACDAVVVAAPIGEPSHKLGAVSTVSARVAEWVTDQLAHDRVPVLVVDTVFDGLEVAGRLVDAGQVVAASRSIRDAALRVRTHTSAPAVRAPGREPTVVIRVDGERVKLAETVKPVTALVSVRALDLVVGKGYEASFAWPFVATRKQLLEWIEQSRAKDIFVTGACADTIALVLGPRARVLGPPRQMALFG